MLGCALLCVLITFQLARAQGTPAVFDGGAVESATTISGGVCSNPVIGISYQLPEGMQPEDATRMREVAALGARANLGIGPEARYFLYGYQEATTIALLCGAASQAGSVQMLASPASIIMAQGPNALERVVSSLAQEAHVQPSPPRVKTVNGLKLECADFHTEVSAPGRGKIEIRGSSCAAVVNSYVVMWNLIGYSEAEWNQLVAGLDSVKVFTAQPLKPPPPPGPSSPSSPQAPVAPDFQARLDAFLKAWLADRNVGKTMSFFDRAAYSAPPFIGSYCGGWYKRGAPAQVAARFMSHNLMGVPSEFPQQTGAPAIFKAWNRLPAPWVREAANDVAKDHFLIARLDSDSLPRIFSGIFTRSDYCKFLESQIQKAGSAYWAVFPELMPDGDLFVIFTLWQKSGGPWKITHMDVICQ